VIKIKTSKEHDFPLFWKIILGGFCILLLAFSTLFIYKFYVTFDGVIFPSTKARADWGTFGDYFGGVLNPIFGFASFLALLVTIIYQAKELKLSRTELELTRNELAHSATALKNQNKAIELQSFEQTFFSWLNTYRSILSSIEDSESNSNGRTQLYKWWESSLSWMHIFVYIRDSRDTDVLNFPERLTSDAATLVPNFKNVKSFLHSSASDFRQDFTKIILYKWGELYKVKEYQLDSLFRILYKLLVWIDSQDNTRISISQKWLYVSIIRSQLSWIEMAFLYMNGLTNVGEKFKPIAEKYALFDNLTFESDLTLQLLKLHHMIEISYSDEAYSSELARVKLNLPKSSEDTMALASAIL
jgi:uncharacterized membrane protein